VNKRPDLTSNRFQTPQYWQVKGATNAFAAFDGVLSTPSVNDGDLVFGVSGLFNIAGVGIFDARGALARAEFFNSSDVLVRVEEINLSGFNLNSYYEWLFTQPSSGNSNYIFRNVPVAAVRAEITIEGENTVLGELVVIGQGYNIGKALYGSRVVIASRSIYEDDQFGVPRYVKKPSRSNATFEIFGEQNFIDTLWGDLRRLSGDRVIYSAQEGRPVTTGAGIVRDLSVPVDYPDFYMFSLEIEGVQ
jgi:hypothetical protein